MVMRGNSAWRKNNRREIYHTWERYLAIMAIIALGVAFFSGLKMTQPAMVNNLDVYVKEYNMYDFRLISTLGLTKDDVQFFAAQEGVAAEGTHTLDILANVGGGEDIVLKAHSITNTISVLNVLKGRAPESQDECLLDYRYFSEDVIGSVVRLSEANDTDTFDALNGKEFTVVGLADSVNYINYDRGSTTLADGTVSAFAYLLEDAFTANYYTDIVISLGSSYRIYGQDYKNLINDNEEHFKSQLENRAEIRYSEILGEAEEKLSDAEEELASARKEYLTERSDAEEELNSALIELQDAEQTIAEQEEKLKDGDKAIVSAERDYLKGIKDYDTARVEYETEHADTLAVLDAQQAELTENIEIVSSAIAQIESSGIETEQYLALKDSLAQLEAGQMELDAGKAEAAASFAAAEAQLAEAKSQLDSARRKIDKNKKDISSGWVALEEGRAEYQTGLQEYLDGKEKANEAFAEAEKELTEAELEIEDARKEVSDIPKPTVYVLNRNQNIGYVNFENDSSIVAGIARVLPLFFFLVAAMVCSTTMTRMVDEQRTQIGTLKALGYSDAAINGRFMFYSGSAAVLGYVAGFLLGTKFFPMAIWKAYGMLYEFAPLEYVFDVQLALISLAASLICSAGVTYVSCKAEMLQVPAQLIRPKAPKAGRRVLLERIPVLWRRISFLHKVSIRNILLYKKRFFMTITGIAGCTALIVAALGINDSIGNVANDQFDSIMVYDYEISFMDPQSSEDMAEFGEVYFDTLSELVFVSSAEVEIIHGDRMKKVSEVATSDPDISKLMVLSLDSVPVPFPSDGEAAINKRLADDFGVVPGDTVSVKINENETADIVVRGVFDNYVGDYILMTAQTHQDMYGEQPQYKNAYATAAGGDIYSVSAQVLKSDSVASVSVLNDMRVMIGNMMQSLNYIIWLVIVFAGALGFVVIYNLNNINITERSREIASLKVLGFFHKENQAYVFRETITLAAIGALSGLVLGKLLHGFIMGQINVDMVSFKTQIFFTSYLIAFIATFVIVLLVNLMIGKKIEKINMTESLKSVE